MAAVTAVTAVVGLGLTAYQMVQANEKQKEAAKQIERDKADLANIQEVNPYLALQAPDISGIAKQEVAQGTADALEAAQDLGEAGAAQVTGIVKAGRDANLKAAEKQAAAVYERDKTVAAGTERVEARDAARKTSGLTTSMEQAQFDQGLAQDQIAAGTQNIFAGLGSIAGEVEAFQNPDNVAKRTAEKQNRALGKTRSLDDNSTGDINGKITAMEAEMKRLRELTGVTD